MQLSLLESDLKTYIGRQLDTFFPDGHAFRGSDIDKAFGEALKRTEYCFYYIKNAAYTDGKGNIFFSHLHADQYASFLYFLSNSLWNISENKHICEKLIALNRTLHGFYFSYKGKLPKIFFFNHPVGSVIGNAAYSDFLVVSQNVTINTGESKDGKLVPELGKGLFLAAGAKIIGNEPIGERVSIGVDAVIYNQAVESDCVVERSVDGKIIIRERRKPECKAQQCFNVKID